MLQLASSGVLELDVPTVSGRTLAANLEWWEGSERRARLRERLATVEGIDPDEVIRSIVIAPLPGTITILGGNLAPDGALVKSTSIAPSLLDADGVYDVTGRARVFATETDAIDAIKRREIAPGEVMVLVGIGPSFGMPETYQVTAALKHVDDGGRIPLITDGRFSGVSTGPCVGHISPEAAGGGRSAASPCDPIRIRVDTHRLSGTVDLLVPPDVVANRTPAPPIAADLPDDTRLWAALQAASGGAWGGCVYDVDAIIDALGRSAAP